ncbi:hypothetical protein l13_19900 [Neisseria weaveri ATCC 51223]|nr:hypothetical protein l13_19900 [Neisseria weaveri ATCC 51223]
MGREKLCQNSHKDSLSAWMGGRLKFQTALVCAGCTVERYGY